MSDESRETDPAVVRREKLEALESRGVEPYPATWDVSHTAAEVLDAFEDDGPEIHARVAGRVVSIRGHGKTTFLHVADRTDRIQAYLRKDDLGEEAYALLDLLDLEVAPPAPERQAGGDRRRGEDVAPERGPGVPVPAAVRRPRRSTRGPGGVRRAGTDRPVSS